MNFYGRVLTISGSDSSSGGGIQGDIKTVAALGGYATTAVTCLAAQNTVGVLEIQAVSGDFVARQMTAVMDDVGVDCIKIGMVYSADVINAIDEVICARSSGIPVVLDPVLQTKTGARLLQQDALRYFKMKTILGVTLVTPNLREAEELTGKSITTLNEMESAAAMLLTMGAHSVLLMGGKLPNGNELSDILVTEDGVSVYTSPELSTTQTHGSGGALSAAVATGLAQGMSLKESVIRARAYVVEAIKQAPMLGAGYGPVNHTIEGYRREEFV